VLKILAISNLFPNPVQPRNGVFTEHRLRALAAAPEIEEVRVISPIPAFPLPGLSFGPYAALNAVPAEDVRHGLKVSYPRYVNIPKIGMHLQPGLMAAALMAVVRRMIAGGFDPDVIDAFYFYPDGVAAAKIARALGKKLVITAYGNDLSLIPVGSPRAARRIREAADQADACTAVCKALADAPVDLGGDASKTRVVLHGVDVDLFRPPEDRAALRARLGLDGPALFTAGHLIERKGMHFAVGALPPLPGATLVIAGDGPEDAALRAQAASLGVADRVRFLGHVDPAQLRDWYGAADAFVLMSSREGIANVMMESMACGTPVLATAVWGAPEVINRPEAGRLVMERTSEALAREAQALFAAPPDRAATARYGGSFTWAQTTRDHLDVYRTFLGPDLTDKD
jgi:teichuronic acid biosynthesis glycosyltransferase TuaC